MKIEISASPKEMAELMAEIWARKTPMIMPEEASIKKIPLINDPKAWRQVDDLLSGKAAD